MKSILWLLEFPEAVIAVFFIAMAILGLSQALADRGIDPRMMQVVGIVWIIILCTKPILKAFDSQQERPRNPGR